MVIMSQKIRNAGTMTEAQYWAKVRSALRQAFRYWKPITQAKQDARRAKKNGGRQKWEYQCNHCYLWFKGDEVEVDHIIPVGSLKCKEDLVQFLDNLTAEEGYQVLCKPCHNIKTSEERHNKNE